MSSSILKEYKWVHWRDIIIGIDYMEKGLEGEYFRTVWCSIKEVDDHFVHITNQMAPEEFLLPLSSIVRVDIVEKPSETFMNGVRDNLREQVDRAVKREGHEHGNG